MAPVARPVEACYVGILGRPCLHPRPPPSASINLVLRRRCPTRPSTFRSRLHSTSAIRLSEPILRSVPAGSDDHYLPFDVPASQPKHISLGPSTLPAPFAPPPPPAIFYGSDISKASSRDKTDELTSLEPSIELRPDLDHLPQTAEAPASKPHNGSMGEPAASKPASARSHISVARATIKRAHIGSSALTHRGPATTASPLVKRRDFQRLEISSKREPQPAPSEIKREPWQTQKRALREKFQDDSWNPRKKVSPDAMEGIRALHAQYPHEFPTSVLADQFKVSPESIRRILKGKWRPSAEQEEDRRLRWDKRGEKIWTDLVEQGVHPPKRWRTMGIGNGPRRSGQDRSRARRDEGETGRFEDHDGNEGSAWMRSLASRIA